MKLQWVNAFIAVVDAGSIHRAARRLGVSQPALSKSLSQLEEELSAPLLIRSSRGVLLTDFGRAFAERARVIVSEVDRARDDVAHLRGRLEGTLAVCVAPVTTLRLTPAAVGQFRRECPRVRLRLYESMLPSAADQLRQGAIELAVGPLNVPLPPNEFCTEPLMPVRMVVVARRDHPLARATRLARLAEADWLFLGAGGSTSTTVERTFEAHGLPVPRCAVECQSLTSALMLLQSSDLLAMISEPLMQAVPWRDVLAIVPIEEAAPDNPIGLIHRADRPLTRTAQLLASHFRRAAQHLAAAPADAPRA